MIEDHASQPADKSGFFVPKVLKWIAASGFVVLICLFCTVPPEAGAKAWEDMGMDGERRGYDIHALRIYLSDSLLSG